MSHGKSLHDPLFPEIAPLAKAIGHEFGEDLCDEDPFVPVLFVAIIRDGDSSGVASHEDSADD